MALSVLCYYRFDFGPQCVHSLLSSSRLQDCLQICGLGFWSTFQCAGWDASFALCSSICLRTGHAFQRCVVLMGFLMNVRTLFIGNSSLLNRTWKNAKPSWISKCVCHGRNLYIDLATVIHFCFAMFPLPGMPIVGERRGWRIIKGLGAKTWLGTSHHRILPFTRVEVFEVSKPGFKEFLLRDT